MHQKRLRADHTFVSKSWGFETWVDNRPEYCGKLLEFVQDRGTSWHFHVLKLETMFCVSGLIEVMLLDVEGTSELEKTVADGLLPSQSSVILNPGESILIPRGRVHRIIGRSERSVLLEVSTQHFDDDSYRVWPADSEVFGK